MDYKLLLVDDEQLIVKSLLKTIAWEELHCTVVGTARNGKEALKKYQQFAPDIVITDIRMPVMDGIELLKNIKEINPKSKAIILSGYDEFSYARDAMKYGASDYILKPIDYDELYRSVEKISKEIKEEVEQLQMVYKNILFEAISGGNPIHHELDACFFKMVCLETSTHTILNEEFIRQKVGTVYHSDVSIFVLKVEPTLYSIIFCSQNRNSLLRVEKDSVRKMLNHFPVDIHFGVGNILYGLRDIYDGHKQALTCLRYKNLFAEKKVITMNDVNQLKNKKSGTDNVVVKAMEFMKGSFEEDIGIDDIADHVGLSVSRLSVVFKKGTGITCLEYLTNIRMEKALFLLKHTSKKTYEIAELVGYTDPRYFSQVFKKKVNLTPSEYRKGEGQLVSK
ncbi:response regulator transcription factor [Bacillus alkalicellulosilyticus]|uniref:response regulator transcription factor n=1 Tax=Alkalihalobacterium alkalicellulosilyticum TaxID=1912214 RepID=UPI000996C8C1|nr:response regulator [Bacillus alkalicellulosilyticus]